VIATGTPEDVAKVEGSYTGRFLRKVFSKAEKQKEGKA
jgi:excinuclease UvrABC ATPase subunit